MASLVAASHPGPRETRAIVLAAILACGGNAWADDGKKPTERASSPGDQIQALRKGVDDAEAAYLRAVRAWKEGSPVDEIDRLWSLYLQKADAEIPKALDLIREDPGSSMAFGVLDWIVSNSRNVVRDQPYVKRAIEQLRDHHTENPGVAPLCGVLGDAADSQHSPTLEFLRTTADKNPDRTARGVATLGLARLTYEKGAILEREQRDPGQAFQEAERLYEIVVERYADCPELLGPLRLAPEKTLGAQARAALQAIRHLRIGSTAPEILGIDLDGHKLRLSDYRGKVVVLTFWATWCSACMALVPHERSLVERMKGKPFVLLGVNGDEDRDGLKSAIEKHRITWPSFWDGGPDGPISSSWDVSGWPRTYVLDRRGVIRFKDVRDHELDLAVDSLLKESAEVGKPGPD